MNRKTVNGGKTWPDQENPPYGKTETLIYLSTTGILFAVIATICFL